MAGRKKKSRHKSEEEETEDTGSVEELSIEKKVELFEAYDDAVSTQQEVEAALEEANEEVNSALKEIYTKVGGGPFRWRNNTVVISKRGQKFRLEDFSEEIQEIG